MVEQWTENPCVPGSIPGGTTLKIPNPLKIRLQGFFLLQLVRFLYGEFGLCIVASKESGSSKFITDFFLFKFNLILKKLN